MLFTKQRTAPSYFLSLAVSTELIANQLLELMVLKRNQEEDKTKVEKLRRFKSY